jgi:hypothetical protein
VSESFDSGLLKRLRGPCHLFVKKMFATRDECVRRNPRIQSAPVFFSAITPGQHRVCGATEWIIYKLGTKEAGPLKFSIRRLFGKRHTLALIRAQRGC